MMKESLSWDLGDKRFCLWDWNLETGTVGLSNNWISLLGFTFDEYLPSSQWFNSLIHPDDITKVIFNLEGHLSGAFADEEFSFRLKCKDDSYLRFESKGMVVLQDPEGRPGHVIWASKLVDSVETHYAEVLWNA